VQRISLNLSRDECMQALILANKSWNYRTIGQRHGVSHTIISRVIQRFRETSESTRRPEYRKPHVTTAVQDRFLRVRDLRERFTTSRSLQRQLATTHNFRISVETVGRRLAEHDLHPRQPAIGSLLTPVHRQARVEFATNHLHWNNDDWGRILFTDESRFFLDNNERRVRVFRDRNERYA
jgi:transposase